MATIRKLGTGKWKAEIVIRQGPGKKPFRRSRTFARKGEAVLWSDESEKKLRAPGGIERQLASDTRGTPTIGDLVARYVSETDPTSYGPTKADYLRKLQLLDISSRIAEDMTSSDWTDFARQLRLEGRDPATVAGYFGTLTAVMKVARAAWGVPVDIGAIADGRFASNLLGYTGKSKKRDRRPSLGELDQLMSYFRDQHESHPRTVPMHFIVAFAVFSGRRQAEICRLQLHDVLGSSVVVRDMKNPSGSRGNHRTLWLTEQARLVAEAHATVYLTDDGRLYPYHPDTVGRHFSTAVRHLGISDLRFHDLRHEALSWLGETGCSAHHMMRVSGHATSQMLDRYVQLEAPGDKYEGWPWLEYFRQLVPSS